MDKIFCLLSFALYFFAPNQYSFLFCVILFVAMLSNAIYLFVNDYKIEILGFNSVFSLSLIFVTYIYPLFIYQVFPTFSLFGFAYNDNVISKATAMVNLAYSMFAFGYMSILKADVKNNMNAAREIFQFPELTSKKRVMLFSIIVIFLFLLVIAAGGLSYFSSQYGGDKSDQGSTLFKIVWVFFQTFCILLVIVNLHANRWLSNIIVCFIMLVLMAVGTRTLPLCIILLMIYAVSMKKNYSIKTIASIGVVAFVLMSLVGRLRMGNNDISDVSSSEIGLWAYFEDFVVCSRNQYVIYDYVQKYGTTHGVSSLSYILAVIPFAQSIVSSMFGLADSEMRSESLTTKWEGTDIGLGTHIVGDVYLAFGLVGVILLFFFLGYIVAKSRRYMFLGSRKGTIIYLVLLSGAMFMCRGSFFYSLKNIVWSLIIISLSSGVVKRKTT